MKHMLIAQSGGPSAAINATVAGVVERCMTSSKVDRIYGAVNGIKGVISGHYVDLTDVLASPEQLDLLCHTPSAALGSCRLKLNNADESQLKEIVDALIEREIGYFVYIGGNDSMDTVDKLSAYIKKHDIRLHRQRPSDGNALLLSAGQARRIFPLLIQQPYFFQKGSGQRLRLILRHILYANGR